MRCPNSGSITFCLFQIKIFSSMKFGYNISRKNIVASPPPKSLMIFLNYIISLVLFGHCIGHILFYRNDHVLCSLVYLLHNKASVYIFVIRGVVLFIYCIIRRQCTYLLSVVLSGLTTV